VNLPIKISENLLTRSSRVVTTGCAAAQISFFVETGGEIQWMAAGRVVGGSGGLGLLLSGLPSLVIGFLVLYAIALIIAPWFYDAIDSFLEMICRSFRTTFSLMKSKSITEKVEEEHELLIPVEEEQLSDAAVDGHRSISARRFQGAATAIAITITTIGAIILVLVLQCVRPTSPPYAHMSGSIPMTIIEAAWFSPINSEFCLPHSVAPVSFPFERFAKFYDSPQSDDWMPRSETCREQNDVGRPRRHGHPGEHGPDRHDHHGKLGLPHLGPAHPRPSHSESPQSKSPPVEKQPHGLHGKVARDASPHKPNHKHEDGQLSVAGCEPLKLSNLDADLLGGLAKQMKSKKPVIKNVLFLILESTRKDVFPLMRNGHPHTTMLRSYGHDNVTTYLDEKLESFGTTASFLTGQPSGFETTGKQIPKDDWRTSFKHGMGAINVNGAITQAAYTLKSLLSSHCGVEPLAVDFTEEVRGRIYQPCLPQILEKMNSALLGKESDQRSADVKAKNEKHWPWKSAEVQSVTDQFDSQDILTEQMGFKTVVSSRTIADPSSKHYPPKQPPVNYFGYPETMTMDYLRDLVVEGKEQQKRMFVSHLTSSPHHPFHTPKDWEGRTSYMGSQRWRSVDPFDDYLNTIQYQDEWISDVFQMLHDVGAIEETLVVMMGDHGLAFSSLDNSHSAVANGHIGNFEIPLLFVHPDLPRIQLNASTTPLSVIPTVLDLMLESDSLPESAVGIAKDVLPKYQGHSLIRDLDFTLTAGNGTSAEAFFEPWHFSAINPGGAIIAIGDASTTFRLIYPLCSATPLRFTDISTDPHEMRPITAWTMDELAAIINVRHGARATEWARLAQDLGRWWIWKQRERWDYWGSARMTSRGGAETAGGIGRIKKEHWWETK